MRLTLTEQQQIFDQAQQKNQSFFVDWKSTAEDIVFNIKQILPHFDITALKEEQEKGTWKQPVLIEKNKYTFDTESDTTITDVISTVNQHLEKTQQTFIFFDTQDDNYHFILINLKDLPSYLEKGFCKI